MVVELTGSVGYVLFYINKGSCEQECPQDPNIYYRTFYLGTAFIDPAYRDRYLIDGSPSSAADFEAARALKLIFTAKNQGDGDVDSFKALCTALAATVGTGNIVGVATAVHAGGPGAFSGCGWLPSSVWLRNTPKVV